MEIQSLSICVPVKNGKCVNNCKYCVVHSHTNPYKNLIESENDSLYYEREYRKRLAFARDNGCNTVILTGTYEPLQNIKFIEKFANWNNQLNNPFRWIELQTVGNLLTETNIKKLRNDVGVNTISISIANLFDDKRNSEIIGMPQIKKIEDICKLIKNTGLTLRLSLNLTSDFENISLDSIILRGKELEADQITFRQLYIGNEWTSKNSLQIEKIKTQYQDVINDRKYRKMETLPFGASMYDISQISVVIDDDCMASKHVNSTLKYLILRENCKLYSYWDTPASLKF